jgi:hypothetical protein
MGKFLQSMNKFLDKLPFKRLAEAKIPAETIAKYSILGKAIPFANQIVSGFAVLLLVVCFSVGVVGNGANGSGGSPIKAPASGSGRVNAESDFEVKLTKDGTGVVITKYVGISTSVRIPATIEGLPVKEVGSNAFSGKIYELIGRDLFEKETDIAKITSVVIPEGVTSIGAAAFSKCENLSSVTLPGTLLDIGPTAFNGCKALASIKLPAGLKLVGEVDMMGIFWNSSLTSFPDPWPAAITTIPARAFQNTKLRSVVIPEGITIIESNAFEKCEELTSVTLPSTIEKIQSDAFAGCTKLNLTTQAALKQHGYTRF